MRGSWRAVLPAVLGLSVPCAAQPAVRLIYPVEHPTRGLIAYGDVALTVEAADNVFGIDRVEFHIAGQRVATDTTYPYSFLWPTAAIGRGLYPVKVVARNTRGDAATLEVGVEVVPSPVSRHVGGSAVRDALLTPVEPALQAKMRDPSIVRGPDGIYYLTGTTGHDPDDMNGGVELWRSADLQQWEYVGLIWSFERDGTWQRDWSERQGRPFRAAWRPQLRWLRGRWHLIFGVPGRGTTLAASTSDGPAGPYRPARTSDGPLCQAVDATLFEDDDGTIYLLFAGGSIVPLDAQWNYERAVAQLGYAASGAQLFKHAGRYYLSIRHLMPSGRVSSYVGVGDSPTGPFTGWHEAVACGGGGGYFQDGAGDWRFVFSGEDDQAPWADRPAVVKVGFDEAGRIAPRRAAESPSSPPD